MSGKPDFQTLKPDWLKVTTPMGREYAALKKLFDGRSLHTVCQAAACPNRNECWGAKTASFLILGGVCTRQCRFCNVTKGKKPDPVSESEPEVLAKTVKELGLKHVVITSVTRDDLPDGGAFQFRRCVRALRRETPETAVELLVPDFKGKAGALESIAADPPDVFGHNVETVPRLYASVRPVADYQKSLEVLKRFGETGAPCVLKSGMMLGLGEEKAEVEAVMDDLRRCGVSVLTLGQYLRPSERHIPVERWITPQEFDSYAKTARAKGFSAVFAAPFVRSSYRAAEALAR